jgi:hypothetical protein
MDSFYPTQIVVTLVLRVRARDSPPSHDPALSDDWRVNSPSIFQFFDSYLRKPDITGADSFGPVTHRAALTQPFLRHPFHQ